jgi:hypothetical protein
MTSNTSEDLITVWGSGPSDLYAGGTTDVFHYDGTSWSLSLSNMGGAQTVFGSGPNDVWVLASTNLWHYDGTSWTAVPLPSGDALLGAFAMGPNDLWFAGRSGELVHRDASGSTVLQASTEQSFSVLDIIGDRIFAAGTYGAVVELQRSCDCL